MFYLGLCWVLSGYCLLHTRHLDVVPLDGLAQALVVLGVQVSWPEHHLLPELPLTLQCRHGRIA